MLDFPINNEESDSPRVHISYEVETENGIQEKTLPFVVGVLGNFSGDADNTPLNERTFIEIDKSNIDIAIRQIQPELNLQLSLDPNDLTQKKQFKLKFKALEDFSFDSICKQIPEIQSLIEIREKIRDLLTDIDLSHTLESELEKLLIEADTKLRGHTV